MQNDIVEGEPGIFPDPIARLLVRLGRLGRRKGADPAPQRPPEPPPAGAGGPAGTREAGADDQPRPPEDS